MSNVKTICTTDDPVDSLEWHIKMKEDKTMNFTVLPAFRPDKGINIELDYFFIPWIEQLGKVVGYKVDSLDKFEKAMSERVAFFDSVGCVVSDHALDVVMYEPATREEVAQVFIKGLAGEKLTYSEISKYKGYILLFLGRLYNKYGWAQQYHIGALRNNSKRALNTLGADTGFDAIEDQTFAFKLAAIMGNLDETDELPKTILYCLNPRDNEVLGFRGPL